MLNLSYSIYHFYHVNNVKEDGWQRRTANQRCVTKNAVVLLGNFTLRKKTIKINKPKFHPRQKSKTLSVAPVYLQEKMHKETVTEVVFLLRQGFNSFLRQSTDIQGRT